MKKLIVIIVIYKALVGALIPDTFMTDPDMQRVGSDSTDKYFERQLFRSVYGIAFTKLRNTSPQGEIMISTDCAWHRVIYTYLEEGEEKSARWIKAYGRYGSGSDEFDEPMGCCIDTTIYNAQNEEYTIYIADKSNNRIVKLKYDTREEVLCDCGTIGSNFFRPKDVACATRDEGGAYAVITEDGNNRISLYQVRFDGTDSLIARYGELGPGVGEFNGPSSAAICKAIDGLGGYLIYVTDAGNNRVVCLRFQSGQGIAWEKDYRVIGNSGFFSVTASQYYCVYVTAFYENRVYVFTPGLGELLYKYGDDDLLNGPKDIYIDWNRVGLTEKWTAATGIQYFKVIPEIREFHPDPNTFDATEDSVRINFRVDETKQYLTMTVMGTGRNLFEDQEYAPGSYSVYWDGRDSAGKVVLPNEYTIKIFCGSHCIGTTQVTVKGTVKSGNLAADLHWTEDGEPYVLIGDVYPPNNQRLLIDPGVKVMPTDDFCIKLHPYYLNGSIIARGTSLDPILFTPHRKLFPEPDPLEVHWKGIVFCLSNSAGNDDSLIIDNCIIEGGGSASAAVDVYNGNFFMSHTEILNSRMHGVLLHGWAPSGQVLIDNCTFRYNDSIPILVPFAYLDSLRDNNFIDNVPNVIGVMSTNYAISDDVIIRNQGVPYWFLNRSSEGAFKVNNCVASWGQIFTLYIVLVVMI